MLYKLYQELLEENRELKAKLARYEAKEEKHSELNGNSIDEALKRVGEATSKIKFTIPKITINGETPNGDK
jgi:hypothetical protein